MEILKAKRVSGKVVRQIVKEIKEGKVLIFPTDTVYGLIAAATNKKAVDRIFQIKKRNKRKPIPIFVRDLKQAKELAEINKVQEVLLKIAWPGKMTFVFWRKRREKLYGVDKKSIALRIPDYPLVSKVLKKISLPLTGTSANISTKAPTTKIKEVLKEFKGQKYQPDSVVDAGNLKPAGPSTVIDLRQGFKILRK